MMALAALVLGAAAPGPLASTTFSLDSPAEATAELRVRCARCDWGRPGREAAVLRLTLDGRYSQHVVTAAGSGPYRVMLGPLGAGPHALQADLERRLSCRGVGTVAVEEVRVTSVPATDAGHEALSRAPFLYLRPDSLRRFTDLPLVMWYERDRAADRRRLRYSVVFSNEDGGTPPDRLMATWGRVTDIEFVYGVTLDAEGRVAGELFQGRDHQLLPFGGRREGSHPLLWVHTENNMLDASGAATIRVAPLPLEFELGRVSREAVMDAQPWTYRVSSAEVRREGRVSGRARPGSGRIADPRRFVYVEACTGAGQAAVSFAVGVRGSGGQTEWIWSDAGDPRWRIARNPDHFPNGCFRGAVPVPARLEPREVAGLRFRSFPRPPREGAPARSAGSGRTRLLRVNRVFTLNEDDTPGPSLYRWEGDQPLGPDLPPAELLVETPR